MATSKPEDAHGLIDLNARLPAGDSPYGVAFGTRTGMRAKGETPNIDEFLLAKADRPTRVAAPRPVHAAVPVATLVSVATPVSTPAEPVASAPADPALLAMVESPAPATSDDSSSYAQRESKAQNLEKFRGGDAIVITSGALIIVLLVVILILLLR